MYIHTILQKNKHRFIPRGGGGNRCEPIYLYLHIPRVKIEKLKNCRVMHDHIHNPIPTRMRIIGCRAYFTDSDAGVAQELYCCGHSSR